MEHGKGNDYNHRVLQAFFVEGQDIGQIDLLTRRAGEVGLNENEYEQSLRTRKYRGSMSKRFGLPRGSVFQAFPCSCSATGC